METQNRMLVHTTPSTVEIKSTSGFFKRLYNTLVNPFRYIIIGKIKL